MLLIKKNAGDDYAEHDLRQVMFGSSLGESESFKRIPLQCNTSSETRLHPLAVRTYYDHAAARRFREKLHKTACLKIAESETEVARILVRNPSSVGRLLA